MSSSSTIKYLSKYFLISISKKKQSNMVSVQKFDQEFTIISGLLLTVVITVRTLADTQCPVVSKAEADKMWLKYLKMETKLHWSFWLLPDIQEKYKSELKSLDLKHVDVNYSEIYGPVSKKCPRINSFLLNLLPDCPVYYVMENDPNRIPQNIVHVKCKCERCLHNNNDDKGCSQVYAYTKVMRRMDACSFHAVLEAVSVACTCSSRIKFVRVA